MAIARLADKLLRRLVPSTEAGACEHSPCYCAFYAGTCKWVYTNCAGTACNVYGSSCVNGC